MYGTAAAITIGLFFILILMLCAWILAIEKLINAARMKGHCKEGSGPSGSSDCLPLPLYWDSTQHRCPIAAKLRSRTNVSAQSPIDDLPAI